ncbi:MAG: rhomboid family intramembrane serine protease [Mesorhizobium sp.]|nr:rhomboid family intramembrane serine protease [Mesorhizobium sp.]
MNEMTDREPDGLVEPEARRREPLFNLPTIVVAMIALCVAIHLVRVGLLTSEQDYGLILRAAFFPARYSGDYVTDIYAFTSPLTASLLHGGWAHLIINMVWLAIFGSPLANRIGPVRFLLFWVLTALGADLLHFLARPDEVVPMLCASGAIAGKMGAAARFCFRIDRSAERPVFSGRRMSIVETLMSRQSVTFLVVWLLINVAAGVGFDFGGDGGIAWEAHIGGMLTGFLGISLFDRAAPRDHPPA